jgi:hypothetical protein
LWPGGTIPVCSGKFISTTDEAQMIENQRALDDFLAVVEQLQFAESVKFLHKRFGELANSGFLDPRQPWLNAFELGAIAKWVYLSGHGRASVPVDWPSVLNAYKTLWRKTEAQAIYPDEPEMVASFVLRFVYQQLPWNLTPLRMSANVQRTLGLFGGLSDAATRLRMAFESESCVELGDFLQVSHALYGLFVQNDCVPEHLLHERLERHFKPAQIAGTLRFLSSTRSQFRKYYSEKVAASAAGDVVYEFNPLLRFPIMQRNEHYWCVCPETINYAATRGIYFHIADQVGQSFSRDFGDAFEDYVINLCNESVGPESVVTEKSERDLGWLGKNNDLTLIFGDAAVLFECKNSGLFSLAKRSGSPTDLSADIRKNLANSERGKGLFQLHGKIAAIKDDGGKRLPEPLMARYRAVKKFFPVIVLYDQILFANTPVTLKNLIDAELRTNGINDFEYQIWHVEELEVLLKTIPKDEICEVIEQKFIDPTFKAMDLSSFLSKKYGMKSLGIEMFVPGGESRAWTILRRLADAGG